MRKVVLLLFILAAAIISNGQMLKQKPGIFPAAAVCYASDKIEKSFIPPPPILKSGEKKTEFIVTYSLFPAEAKEAFEYALNIWAGLIESSVPIHIEANWRPMSVNILANCSSGNYLNNFEKAPVKDIYYPIAIAEKITGQQITGSSQPDIITTFNNSVNWYFGTDGETPLLRYDFVTVVLHELAHGLGFNGFFYINNNIGGYGYWDYGDATSFDYLVEDKFGNRLTDITAYNVPSEKLKISLTSGFLYANSPVAMADGNNSKPRLYAPTVWDSGSSVYHFNRSTYPAGNENSLMTPSFGTGKAVHNPGPLTMGVLADLGWKNLFFDFKPVKDREIAGPVVFETKIESDFPLDSSEIYIVISDDNMPGEADSIPLIYDESDYFKTEWEPDTETASVQYYISAKDVKNRIFTLPDDVPESFFTLNFGPDTIMPQIDHIPVPYYFANGTNLKIEANVFDNLGVDTVYAEYWINNVLQPPFGLKNETDDNYSEIFPIDPGLLQDGNIVEYTITAIDASSNKNIVKIPQNGKFSFKIESLSKPVTTYQNDFNSPSSDFILYDFDIYTAEGFTNGALHSDHPYISPDTDNEEFNFITILKKPVILSENSEMSFDEIVLIEPGTAGTVFGDFEFWDYVIVEGSTDMGKTWLPVADGYDSRENIMWEAIYNITISGNNSTGKGKPEHFVNRRIDILKNGNFLPGDTVVFRFRLFSDPYANGWGWAIDNLSIQAPVTAGLYKLLPNSTVVYPNPSNGIFTIEGNLTNMVEKLEFEIINIFGQKIKSVVLNQAEGKFSEKINLENSKSGIYLIIIKENEKHVFTRKIILN